MILPFLYLSKKIKMMANKKSGPLCLLLKVWKTIFVLIENKWNNLLIGMLEFFCMVCYKQD